MASKDQSSVINSLASVTYDPKWAALEFQIVVHVHRLCRSDQRAPETAII